MSKKTDRIRRELARIAKKSGGILWPHEVVDEARPASSPLHSRFEWDNVIASDKYRLWQARQLIAITLSVSDDGEVGEQVWVSLKPDREEAGGYRSLIAVLSDADLRAQLLADALADMEVFEQKYRHLQELAEVFAMMAKTKKRRRAA